MAQYQAWAEHYRMLADGFLAIGLVELEQQARRRAAYHTAMATAVLSGRRYDERRSIR